MKNKVLLGLLLGLLSVVFAAGQGHPVNPSLYTACNICTPTDQQFYFGYQYKPSSKVQLDIQGPSSYTLVTTVDHSGQIYVNDPSLTYLPGNYLVVASTIQGQTITPVVSTSFVQQ